MTDYTEDQFRTLIRQKIKNFPSQRQAAFQWRLTPQYLNDILKERRECGHKLAQSLGYDRVVYYRKKSKEQLKSETALRRIPDAGEGLEV